MNVHQGQRRQPPLSHASSVVHVQLSILMALALLSHSQLLAGIVQQIFRQGRKDSSVQCVRTRHTLSPYGPVSGVSGACSVHTITT